MRLGRSKADPDAEVGYYHCLSRVVDRRFVMGEEEKEKFVALMRGYEAFSGLQIITFCILSNHFHLLVAVPRRPKQLPTDAELVERVAKTQTGNTAATLAQDLRILRERGRHKAAEELRELYFTRMWDISWFMRVLKQRFSQWHNKRNARTGTLWEDRFKSVLIEGSGPVLATIAAYIDLNPIRAGIVRDPKDYRWCGYAQAAAGLKIARRGLAIAVEAIAGSEVAANRLMAEYRKHLYFEGEAVEPDDQAETAGRRGFTREKVEEVLAAGGKLELCEALHCRVRYFCDAVVLGSKPFVEAFFAANRAKFPARSKRVPKPLRQLNLPAFFALRDLRTRLIY